MLTSSASQYLHPDYLQPLPTTLDAKKSPLALLAQTCSSIGKDTTPSKAIIPPLEKKEGSSGRKTESPKTGRSSPEDRKSQPSAEKRESSSPSGDGKSNFRAPPPKDIPPLVPISSSSSDKRASSASPVSSKTEREREKDNSSVSSSQGVSGSSAGVNSNSRISLSCGNMLLEVNHQEAASAALPKPSSAPGLSSMPHHPSLGSTLKPDPLSAAHHGLAGLSSAYGGCLPMFSHQALSLENSAAALHPGLGHHGGLSLAAAAKAAGSPYTYARVKTTAGATTLVPVCRDPYCTNCQVTMQGAQLSQCAAGCTQCSHEKLTGPGLPPTSLGTVPVMSLGPAGLASSASSLPLSSSLYHHAFGLVPSHHGLPYVCNWVSTGSDYCGKRFSTSEELLQHLRTHTAAAGEGALAAAHHAASLSAYSSLGLPAPSPLACHTGHYPGSLSPNSIRQSYPRSLSPNSILAARYHPYKSPLSSLQHAPGSSALPGTLPSALGAYYSPYALYGQRLGAAVAP